MKKKSFIEIIYRLIAALIDSFIATVVFIVIIVCLGFIEPIRGSIQLTIAVLFGSGVILLRDITDKSSIGKRILRLETYVEKSTKKNCGVKLSIIRNLPLLLFCVLAFLTADEELAKNIIIESSYYLILLYFLFDFIYIVRNNMRIIDRIFKIVVAKKSLG